MSSAIPPAAGPRCAAHALPRLAVLVAAVLLAACSGSSRETASQTAARVNKSEITVHQINFVLQQQRGLRPEQAEAASAQILERLIDQELAVQKAGELRLDRDPRVVQQLEAMKREVVARAYAERVGDAATRPTPEEIKAYYDANPALFSQRRVYSLQEIAIEATPEQVATLRGKIGESRNIQEVLDYLRSNDIRFAANQAVRAAEQLPLASLAAFAAMKPGQAMLNANPRGAQLIVVADSREQPVTEEQARPAIEQFLLNQRKRELLEQDRLALRGAATVQYVGKFAETAPGTAGAPPEPAAAAESLVPPAQAPAAPGTALDPAAITRGMGFR